MTRHALLLLFLLAPALFAGADSDYRALLKAHEGKRHLEALEKAETFLKEHSAHRNAGTACYYGAKGGLNAGEYDRAEVLYKTLLEAYPDNQYAIEARDDLVTVYDAARKLEACIAQCRANIKSEPDSPRLHRWRYMIGQCRYRAWQFEQAEKDLKAFKDAHPDSRYMTWADHYLERINPQLDLDENGVQQGYDGKFREDARFQAALKQLPEQVEQAWKILKRTLGVDLQGARVVFRFEDKGFTRDTTRATAETIALDYRPVTLMTFYTEHVVVSAEDHSSRVVHELKHAGFRTAMGQVYLDLPQWVREGLAVYGAEQLEARLAAIVGGEVFAGRDPRAVLNGIDNNGRTINDYLEDAAAFQWLETRKRGGVHEYCRRLIKGEEYRQLFAEIAGLDYPAALEAAVAHARKLVIERLGEGEESFLKVRDAEFARRRAGTHLAWYRKEGVKGYRAWLAAHPDHPLAPNCRYRLGKALILIGEHDRGREVMEDVIRLDQVRSSLCDDAQYWIALSYDGQGDADNAKQAWGVLLRDYSWSRQAIANRHKHSPAGPVKAD